ncbi:diguanylate cyclase domain-containing protein [Orrella sp. 11846]|uniref:diguanylate cyclase domain-containing protein n=1 Tax=Orrella sp. 11846 TaxID=3409913 RepID=UPI003B59691A
MSRHKLYTQFLRFLLPLLLLTYCVAAILTAMLYSQDQRIQAQNHRMQTIETFGRALAKPLWDCNSLTAQGIIDSVTLQPDVLWASVPDQCGQKTIEAGINPQSKDIDTVTIPLHYLDEFHKNHYLGDFKIGFHAISLLKTASNGLLTQLIIFLSLLVTVLFGAMWSFERTIGKPLQRLRQAMHQHKTLDPIPGSWTSELTEVTQTYNQQVDQLNRQARHDSLTGLANRLKLEEDLVHAIRQAKETQQAAYLLLLDLDKFKIINDQYGHAAGDKVLQIIAARLRKCVYRTDTVARMGGDEFVIIVNQTLIHVGFADTVEELIERIKDNITRPIAWEGTHLEVGTSIGVAQLILHGETSDTLLAYADANMYQQKSQQPNLPR